jgi:beta-glucosidase
VRAHRREISAVKDWSFKGFVISDWGGTHSTEKASTAGLDQVQPMADFLGPKLKAAVEAGQVPMSEIDDHARRVLYAEFLSGGCRRTYDSDRNQT